MKAFFQALFFVGVAGLLLVAVPIIATVCGAILGVIFAIFLVRDFIATENSNE